MSKLEWNDCESCKSYKQCYYRPKGTDAILKRIHEGLWALTARDLCMNNGKRFFVDDVEGTTTKANPTF